MEAGQSVCRFDQAVSGLCPSLREILIGLPKSAKQSAFEVRLRADGPITVICPGNTWFVDNQSRLHNLPRGTVIVTAKELAESVVGLCAYSVQSHQEELRQGYLSLEGGHRAGICGTAVRSGDDVTAVRDVTSINLRIARQVPGSADKIMEEIFQHHLAGVLIMGIPSSGKTTVLRDIARQLGNGGAGRVVKVAVVDERGEIGAVYQGVPQNNLGISCDVLNGYPKGQGIMTAIRTMSPEIIVCDEIGGSREVESVLECLNCGVKIVASVHAGTVEELMKRPQVRQLLAFGAFDYIIRLGSAEQPGEVVEILEVGELISEVAGPDPDIPVLVHGRCITGIAACSTGANN